MNIKSLLCAFIVCGFMCLSLCAVESSCALRKMATSSRHFQASLNTLLIPLTRHERAIHLTLAGIGIGNKPHKRATPETTIMHAPWTSTASISLHEELSYSATVGGRYRGRCRYRYRARVGPRPDGVASLDSETGLSLRWAPRVLFVAVARGLLGWE